MLRSRAALARWLSVGLLALLALGLAGWALAAYTRHSSLDKSRALGIPSRVPLSTDKSLGVTTDLARYDRAAREAVLASMKAAGVRWIRQRFAWDAIEPERGRYRWEVWDEIVEQATRHNIALIAVLDGSPGWARKSEDSVNPLAPPGEFRDLGRFAGELAARYREHIDYYQVWDEPNIAPHWGARWVDPGAYAQLLQEAAIQIRSADPGASILVAALAPNVELGGTNMSDLRFLEALYGLGAAEWFDIVAAQPYGFDEGPLAGASADRLNFARIELLRQVMLAHGDEATAIWAVAFGWSEREASAIGRSVGELFSEGVATARARWPWLGPMLWAAWAPADSHGDYALVGASNEPTEGLAAFRSVATAPLRAYPGVYPANHGSAGYAGGWRVTPSGADIGASGDRVAIQFWGTGLDLTVRRGDYRAFLFVTVDGRAANALPKDREGKAYLVLYDPLHAVESVPVARRLAPGEHTAEIVAEGGWGQWAIVGWTIWGALMGQPAWLPALLLLGSVSCGLGAVWVARPEATQFRRKVSVWFGWGESLDDRVALLVAAAVALLLYVMVGTIPSLVVLAVLAAVLCLRPSAGLPLIAAALPFYQIGKPLLGKVFSMVEILTLATAFGWGVNWLIRRLVQPEHGASRQPRVAGLLTKLSGLDWGVVSLVVMGLLSLFWAEHLREALREFRTVVLEAGAFYALLRLTCKSRGAIWRVADAWVLGGLAVALVGLYQWAFGQNLITADGVWRVRGFYGSPNNLALYLGRLLPIAISVTLWGQHARRRWYYGLAGVCIAAALVLTYSRGAWLLGIPAAVLFLAAVRGRRTFVVAALAVVGLALIAFLASGSRLASLLDLSQGSTYFRVQLWQSSWAMIRDHPVLGVGLDNFLYHYRTRYVLPTAWEEFNLSHPHNVVLDFWLRLGLPGLAAFVWLVVLFFRHGWRTSRQLAEGDGRLLGMGLMASVVYMLAHGLVDHAFFLVDLAFAFMLILALIQAIGREG